MKCSRGFFWLLGSPRFWGLYWQRPLSGLWLKRTGSMRPDLSWHKKGLPTSRLLRRRKVS